MNRNDYLIEQECGLQENIVKKDIYLQVRPLFLQYLLEIHLQQAFSN